MATDLIAFTLGRFSTFNNGQSLGRFNVTGLGVGGIGVADRTGTVDRVAFWWQNKTGTPGTLRVGIEGVTSTRQPDGTYKSGGNAFVDFAGTTANGAQTVTLGSSWSATAGDIFAVTIREQSGTFDASNFGDVLMNIGNPGNFVTHSPFATGLSGGSWANSNLNSGNVGAPGVCPLYSDDAPVRGFHGGLSSSDTTWNSSTTSALYRGIKIIPAITLRLRGVWAWYRPVSGAPATIHELHVFDGSNGELLSVSPTLDGNLNSGTNNNGLIYLPCSPLTLTSGSTYRIALKPTTATNPTQMQKLTFATSAIRQAAVGDVSSTVGSSTFTWTDSTTDNFWPILPEFDQVTAASSGGGGCVLVF